MAIKKVSGRLTAGMFANYKESVRTQMLDPKVCAIVNENKQIFEANSELIDNLLTETSMQDQEEHLFNDQPHESSEFNE